MQRFIGTRRRLCSAAEDDASLDAIAMSAGVGVALQTEISPSGRIWRASPKVQPLERDSCACREGPRDEDKWAGLFGYIDMASCAPRPTVAVISIDDDCI